MEVAPTCGWLNEGGASPPVGLSINSPGGTSVTAGDAKHSERRVNSICIRPRSEARWMRKSSFPGLAATLPPVWLQTVSSL